jgi:hypothetical protein
MHTASLQERPPGRLTAVTVCGDGGNSLWEPCGCQWGSAQGVRGMRVGPMNGLASRALGWVHESRKRCKMQDWEPRALEAGIGL